MHDERDTRRTTKRALAVALYQERRIVPSRHDFLCSSLPLCSRNVKRPLITGNWIFVGCDYGAASVNGHQIKVLFVAMDRGGYGGSDGEEFKDTQNSFKTSIESPKNPHMGGVALILKHLLNEHNPIKLSGQFALTNAVKCAKHTGKMTTRASPTMIRECANHLLAEIRMLAPDIIVTQGSHPASTVLSFYENSKLIRDFTSSSKGRLDVWVASDGIVILRTPHPARQKDLRWRYGQLPGLWNEAITLARETLIRQLQTQPATGQDNLVCLSICKQ